MLAEQPVSFDYDRGGCRITCLVTGQKWRQNTYIVTHRASCRTIVIDPGDNAERIIRRIEEGGGTLARILLTHPHHDHVGAAAELSEHYDLACLLHRQDLRLLVHAPMYALTFANRTIPAVSRFQTFEELCHEDEQPRLLALHTPGHTKGSVCYLFDGFLFTGDTLLYRHVGRTDLPGSSSQELSASIEQIVGIRDGETVIFPGHGRPWSVGEAREWWLESVGEPPVHTSFVDEIH